MTRTYIPIAPVGEAETWRDNAACAGHPQPDLWFGTQGSVDTMRAKNICAECPVRTLCLQEAFTYPEPEDHGTMGGLDEWERRRMRRQAA